MVKKKTLILRENWYIIFYYEKNILFINNFIIEPSKTFFHNPYINRMWSEIDTYYLIEDPNLK